MGFFDRIVLLVFAFFRSFEVGAGIVRVVVDTLGNSPPPCHRFMFVNVRISRDVVMERRGGRSHTSAIRGAGYEAELKQSTR